MHPILERRQRLLAYLLGWALAGALLASAPWAAGEARLADALVFVVPLALVYGFVCLAVWYPCRATPLARAGLWRILRLFESHRLPLTIFAVARALQRHPEAVSAYRELGHEIACHGLRWISYQQVDEATERQHLEEATALLRSLTGEAPLGWYTGRDSPNTRRLVADHGGFEYDSDCYGDDLPFWLQVRKSDHTLVPHLVVPYTLDANDMRFALPQGYSHGDPFFQYLRDAFDVHYAEGNRDPADGGGGPTMMSIGMHCRLLGRPGRMRALQRFLDHVQSHDRVWIARRIDIARHWRQVHPFDAATAFVWE